MRILSDFHDYYDAVQATGQDQTLLYQRKREEVEVRDYPFPTLSCWDHSSAPFGPRLQQHIVGFCGRIYPVLVLIENATSATAVCHTIDDVDTFVEVNYSQRAFRQYKGDFGPGCVYRTDIQRHFAECGARTHSFGTMFAEKRCPIFVGTGHQRRYGVSGGTIVYNSCLRQLEFFRLVDTYTAFQEIAMFLGGLAMPLKDIPAVPDKIMVGVKGFDEWSFRRPPAKRPGTS